MNSKTFGYLLAWNCMLLKIEQGRIKSQLAMQAGEDNQYNRVIASLTEYLEDDRTIYEALLISIVPFLPKMKKGLTDTYSSNLNSFTPEYCDSTSTK